MFANSNRSGSIEATPEDARGARVPSSYRSGRISDNRDSAEEKVKIGIRPQEIVMIDGVLRLVDKPTSK